MLYLLLAARLLAAPFYATGGLRRTRRIVSVPLLRFGAWLTRLAPEKNGNRYRWLAWNTGAMISNGASLRDLARYIVGMQPGPYRATAREILRSLLLGHEPFPGESRPWRLPRLPRVPRLPRSLRRRYRRIIRRFGRCAICGPGSIRPWLRTPPESRLSDAVTPHICAAPLSVRALLTGNGSFAQHNGATYWAIVSPERDGFLVHTGKLTDGYVFFRRFATAKEAIEYARQLVRGERDLRGKRTPRRSFRQILRRRFSGADSPAQILRRRLSAAVLYGRTCRPVLAVLAVLRRARFRYQVADADGSLGPLGALFLRLSGRERLLSARTRRAAVRRRRRDLRRRVARRGVRREERAQWPRIRTMAEIILAGAGSTAAVVAFDFGGAGGGILAAASLAAVASLPGPKVGNEFFSRHRTTGRSW